MDQFSYDDLNESHVVLKIDPTEEKNEEITSKNTLNNLPIVRYNQTNTTQTKITDFAINPINTDEVLS